MRGADGRSGALFSYVDLEVRVPHGHPLRTIRLIVNEALAGLSPGFHDLYARVGRPSIAPEMLLRALLLQAFYSIRSERQLMERLDFDLLFRWFVGLGVDAPVWNHSTFSKNRDRLLAGDIAAEFLAQVLDQPRIRRLLSSEHFSVDGSLVEAWASMKSFRPKEPGEPPTGGRNDSRDFHGERRANDSHASTTDPDARLYRKGPGQEAKLCFVGHVVMELRERRVTPHIAQNTSGRRSAIDRRTTRHPGYGASPRVSKRIEEAFGWIKTIAGQARTKLRGLARVRWSFTLAAAAYNLVRLPRLLAGSAG